MKAPDFPDEIDKYDHSKIGQIVTALDYLRIQAKETGNEEIYTVINSAFNMCFVTYYLLHHGADMPHTPPA